MKSLLNKSVFEVQVGNFVLNLCQENIIRCRLVFQKIGQFLKNFLMNFLKIKSEFKTSFSLYQTNMFACIFWWIKPSSSQKSLKNLRFESLYVYINYGGFCTLILYWPLSRFFGRPTKLALSSNPRCVSIRPRQKRSSFRLSSLAPSCWLSVLLSECPWRIKTEFDSRSQTSVDGRRDCPNSSTNSISPDKYPTKRAGLGDDNHNLLVC